MRNVEPVGDPPAHFNEEQGRIWHDLVRRAAVKLQKSDRLFLEMTAILAYRLQTGAGEDSDAELVELLDELVRSLICIGLSPTGSVGPRPDLLGLGELL